MSNSLNTAISCILVASLLCGVGWVCIIFAESTIGYTKASSFLCKIDRDLRCIESPQAKIALPKDCLEAALFFRDGAPHSNIWYLRAKIESAYPWLSEKERLTIIDILFEAEQGHIGD